MAYQLCQLGSYTYARNPQKGPNPARRSVTVTTTLVGTCVDDWGFIDADRVITHNWDFMPLADFNDLNAIFLAGGTVAFTDEWGVAFSEVVILSLAADFYTAGGALAAGVTLVMQVVAK